MRKISWYSIIVCFCCCAFGCLDADYYKITVPTPTPSLSIPIVHLKSTVGELAEFGSDNVRVGIDEDGRVTLFYEGEIIRRTSIEVFPPFPLFADFPIVDTVAPIPLPIGDELIFQKATFKESSFVFKFLSQFEEDIEVTVRMPELSKDGQVFEQFFDMKYVGPGEHYFESESISLDGYEVNSSNSTINVNYDARRPNGERIKLEEVNLNIDVLWFSYVEGFFGNRQYNLTGSVIPIGVFNNWESGGFSFDKPELVVSVDNSFGFPVTTFFSKLNLNTLSGNVFEIESSTIEDGIEFGYPEVSEQGVIKSTSFSINAENSNIEDVFNEKATQLNYDIQAVVNPETEDPVVGFFDENSFFTIDAAVVVPLHTKIEDLVLSKAFDIDLVDYDNVSSGEIILSTKNSLPIDVDFSIVFEDEDGTINDYIMDGSFLTMEAGDETISNVEDQVLQVFRFPINATDWQNIRLSSKIRPYIRINTPTNTQDGYIWILENQGLEMSLSATINQ